MKTRTRGTCRRERREGESGELTWVPRRRHPQKRMGRGSENARTSLTRTRKTSAFLISFLNCIRAADTVTNLVGGFVTAYFRCHGIVTPVSTTWRLKTESETFLNSRKFKPAAFGSVVNTKQGVINAAAVV